jgi:hypothetical protein
MALAVFIHGMVDVNMPLRIFADTMRIPVFDVRRQFAPVVDGFVSVGTGTQDRTTAARFFGGAQNQRSGQAGKKRTAGRLHGSESITAEARVPWTG